MTLQSFINLHCTNLGTFCSRLFVCVAQFISRSKCKKLLTWKPCVSSPTPTPRRAAPGGARTPQPVALKMRKFEKSKRKGRNNCHRRYPLPSTFPLKKIIRIVTDLRVLLTGEMTKKITSNFIIHISFCFQVSSISILNPLKGNSFEVPSLFYSC